MEQTVTIKCKIKLDNQSAELALAKSMEQYRQACNEVSRYMFNHSFEMNQTKLNKALYHTIRSEYGLKAQMAQSAIRNVVARYRTVKTQLSQKPYRYNTGEKDQYGNDIWHSAKRDLTWLWHPISFKRPQLDLQRNRDWSYKKNGNLSLNTVKGRIEVKPVCHGFNQYLDGSWKLGIAKVLNIGGKWYLHISAIKELPDYIKEQSQHVVGIDRGLRFLATTYDEQGQTHFFNGQAIVRKRRKFMKLRQQLQSKGTKSAKRRLKKIGQRENRWMTDINHQLSKTLVNRYGSNTLFTLENLVNVRFATEHVVKTKRYEQVSWAFYQLGQFLTYKAHLHGSEVVQVSPKYTSQRCPKCGRIWKQNRNHQKHLYTCDRCGYSSNDDRIGAMNIQLLGTQYISGNRQPSFKTLTTNE
ncbi:RNA-guided endonuclease TnpB family protein [Lactobacillus corticis]|uniref:Transposase n=1 Tax=Lactobacillus corticis TaxID=2201249 RepID=A0A916QJF6_9LACO|nr:RNA-guided endonuclease TnpB family protein [Lactobacillus corticis]GFZ26847.1 transposase [Lactobacillus corticis]